jgi:hypothetical protein
MDEGWRRGSHQQNNVGEQFNMKISITNVVTFNGKYPVFYKTILLCSITEKIYNPTTLEVKFVIKLTAM